MKMITSALILILSLSLVSSCNQESSKKNKEVIKNPLTPRPFKLLAFPYELPGFKGLAGRRVHYVQANENDFVVGTDDAVVVLKDFKSTSGIKLRPDSNDSKKYFNFKNKTYRFENNSLSFSETGRSFKEIARAPFAKVKRTAEELCFISSQDQHSYNYSCSGDHWITEKTGKLPSLNCDILEQGLILCGQDGKNSELHFPDGRRQRVTGMNHASFIGSGKLNRLFFTTMNSPNFCHNIYYTDDFLTSEAKWVLNDGKLLCLHSPNIKFVDDAMVMNRNFISYDNGATFKQAAPFNHEVVSMIEGNLLTKTDVGIYLIDQAGEVVSEIEVNVKASQLYNAMDIIQLRPDLFSVGTKDGNSYNYETVKIFPHGAYEIHKPRIWIYDHTSRHKFNPLQVDQALSKEIIHNQSMYYGVFYKYGFIQAIFYGPSHYGDAFSEAPKFAGARWMKNGFQYLDAEGVRTIGAVTLHQTNWANCASFEYPYDCDMKGLLKNGKFETRPFRPMPAGRAFTGRITSKGYELLTDEGRWYLYDKNLKIDIFFPFKSPGENFRIIDTNSNNEKEVIVVFNDNSMKRTLDYGQTWEDLNLSRWGIEFVSHMYQDTHKNTYLVTDKGLTRLTNKFTLTEPKPVKNKVQELGLWKGTGLVLSDHLYFMTGAY